MKHLNFLIAQYVLLFAGVAQVVLLAPTGNLNRTLFIYGTFIVLVQILWHWVKKEMWMKVIFVGAVIALLAICYFLEGYFPIGHLVLGLSLAELEARRVSVDEDEPPYLDRGTSILIVILVLLLALLLFQGRYADAFVAFGLTAVLIFIHKTMKREGLLGKREQQMTKERYDLEENQQMLEDSVSSLADIYTLRERNRISREIHDSVGHALSAIVIQLGAMQALAAKKDAEDGGESKNMAQIGEMAGKLRLFAQDSLQDLRQVIADNKPTILAGSPLAVALQDLINKSKVHTGMDIELQQQLKRKEWDDPTQLLVYRFVQEGLSNASKHGKASKVKVYVIEGERELVVTVQDNGHGTNKVISHVGLIGLEERAEDLNGQVSYQSKVGEGFTLNLVLRLEDSGRRASDDQTAARG